MANGARVHKMHTLCMCIINRQPEAETRKMRTESFNLRKQQTWANGKRREKYNYDKNTHTHRFQNAALNEKYHGLLSCANTLSSSFSFYLSVSLAFALSVQFWRRSTTSSICYNRTNKNKHSPCEIPF